MYFFFFKFDWIGKFSYLYYKLGCPTADPSLSILNSWALMGCYLCSELQFLLIITSIKYFLLVIWNNVSLHFCNKPYISRACLLDCYIRQSCSIMSWCDSLCYIAFFVRRRFTFSPRGTRNYLEFDTPCEHQ